MLYFIPFSGLLFDDETHAVSSHCAKTRLPVTFLLVLSRLLGHHVISFTSHISLTPHLPSPHFTSSPIPLISSPHPSSLRFASLHLLPLSSTSPLPYQHLFSSLSLTSSSLHMPSLISSRLLVVSFPSACLVSFMSPLSPHFLLISSPAPHARHFASSAAFNLITNLLIALGVSGRLAGRALP